MPSILVIDDNEATCNLLRVICTNAGYEVTTCFTAQEGIEILHRITPAVVFIDLQLPGEMNGWQAISFIKSHPELSSIAVIAMSAGSHHKTAAEAGSDEFIEKPFTSQQVVECVQRYV